MAASMQYAVRSESIRSITLTAWLTTSAGAVLSCSTAWPFRVAVPLALRTKARSLPDSKAGTGSEAPPAQDAPRPVCLLEVRAWIPIVCTNVVCRSSSAE